jgi:hypothetical protein
MPPDDMYGGLPFRNKEGSVIFDNETRLARGFIPELFERLQHGAILGQCYEVLHFPPSERREGPFKGYVAYNYRDKMEASGWKSMTDLDPDTLSKEELNMICDRVRDENRRLCRPRVEYVEDNPGRRTMSKLRVNALWGKYVQADHSRHRLYLDSLKEYLEIIQSPRVKRESVEFRQIYGDMFECRYENLNEEWERAHNINPYLAASVTGWARVILHKKIRETSAAYCDTDSVVYLHKPGVHPDKWGDEGSGIGCWGDELEAGLKGSLFMALAPKCYTLMYDHPNSKGEMYVVKSKGVTMTHENHILINPHTYETMLHRQQLLMRVDPPMTRPLHPLVRGGF